MSISVNINGLRVHSVTGTKGLRRALLNLSEEQHKILDQLIELQTKYKTIRAEYGNINISNDVNYFLSVNNMISIIEDQIEDLTKKGL